MNSQHLREYAVFLAVIAALAPAPSFCPAAPLPEGFVKSLCIKCHGADKQSGDRRFDKLTNNIRTPDEALLWQEILDQLNLGEMPPKKEKQPQKAELLAAVDAITQSLADATQRFKGSGSHTVLRRLNSYEYQQTIGDLLGLNVSGWNPTANFPPESRVGGFDNNAEAQVTSGMLLDHYFVAAEEAIRRATAFGPKPENKSYAQKSPFYFEKKGSKDLPKLFQVDRYRWVSNTGYDDLYARHYRGGHIGFKPMAHGGAPQSGSYTIRIQAAAIDLKHHYDFLDDFRNGDPIVMELAAVNREGSVESTGHITTQRTLALVELTSDKPQWLEWTVYLERGEEPEIRFRNGVPAAKALSGKLAKNTDRYPELKAALMGKPGKAEAMLKAYLGPKLRIWEMQVKGPQLEQWPMHGHAMLFGKLTPDQINRTNIPERLRIFAEAAFRRPLRQGELIPIEKLVTTKLDAGMKPLEALQLGFQAILCSPAFLHLHEGSGKLDDYALASRLSYFLWSSMPDSPLLKLAASGKLHEPAVLGPQVDRMLADPKSQRFVQNFIRLWLNLDHIGEMPVSTDFVSFYRDNLETAMRGETEMFFRHILDKNLLPREFLAADYTFVNRELALHYGLPPVEGVQLRQVLLPKGGVRGGLLTQASFLTASANGVDTSPVVRGVFVQQRILGYTPPPPPPDVPIIEPDASGATNIREQLAKHRANETCAACHRKIDPFGFALENFNAIGGWRTNYSKDLKINSSGVLPTGEKFANVTDFRSLLISRHAQFTRSLTEKIITYALGREPELADRAVIDGIMKDLTSNKGGFKDLIQAVVLSESFRKN
jgi:hypothetical protein